MPFAHSVANVVKLTPTDVDESSKGRGQSAQLEDAVELAQLFQPFKPTVEAALGKSTRAQASGAAKLALAGATAHFAAIDEAQSDLRDAGKTTPPRTASRSTTSNAAAVASTTATASGARRLVMSMASKEENR